MTINKKIKKFNELTIEELYNILRLRSEIFVVEQKCTYNDFDDKDLNAIHFFYQTENDKIIAYARIYEKSKKIISFGRVCVKEDMRKKGIGKKIISDLLEYIQKNEKQKIIVISAQEYLINFYKNFGFREISETYLEDGIAHINMKKDL